jgi:hypothetical protein
MVHGAFLLAHMLDIPRAYNLHSASRLPKLIRPPFPPFDSVPPVTLRFPYTMEQHAVGPERQHRRAHREVRKVREIRLGRRVQSIDVVHDVGYRFRRGRKVEVRRGRWPEVGEGLREGKRVVRPDGGYRPRGRMGSASRWTSRGISGVLGKTAATPETLRVMRPAAPSVTTHTPCTAVYTRCTKTHSSLPIPRHGHILANLAPDRGPAGQHAASRHRKL